MSMSECRFPGMSASRALALLVPAVVAVGGIAFEARAQLQPELGVEASADEIAGWALTIMPDGAGLPPGSGTAVEGASVYASKCLACHGPEGRDGLNDRLVGGHGTIGDPAPDKTVGSYWPYATTLFDYVRRAMPFTEPQSLSDDEVYAVTAYLLALNGIIEDNDVVDAASLPAIEMPNAGNFFSVYDADAGQR